LIGAFSGGFFMPESVTGFQLLEKPDNLLIIMNQSGATFAVLPTKIREEPIFETGR
jgi:hypothetical protein